MNNCQLFLLESTGEHWVDFNDSYVLYSPVVDSFELILNLKMIEYRILYYDHSKSGGGSIEVKKSHILQHIREKNIDDILN